MNLQSKIGKYLMTNPHNLLEVNQDFTVCVLISSLNVAQKAILLIGSGYFAVDGNLPLESILP